MSKGNDLAPNRRISLPCKVWTFIQRSYNQGVGCLLCSLVSIYEGDSLISGQILDIEIIQPDIQQFHLLYKKKVPFQKQIIAKFLPFLVL